MRVKEPVCPKCFYKIYHRNDLKYLCTTTGVGICSQCKKIDHLVVDYVRQGETLKPENSIMQTGVVWKENQW